MELTFMRNVKTERTDLQVNLSLMLTLFSLSAKHNVILKG